MNMQNATAQKMRLTGPSNSMLMTEAPKATNWEIAWYVTLLLLAYPTYYVARSFRLFGQDIARVDQKKLFMAALITVIVLVLLFALSVLLAGLARNTGSTDFEGIVAPPFSLSDRQAAAAGGTYGLLPMNVGDFALDFTTVPPSNLLQHLNVPIKDSITRFYVLPSGEAVEVSAAEIIVEDQIVGAMRDLRKHIAQIGNVGNFAIGIDEVSYLYYRIGDTKGLAWSNGPWVYIVSGTSLANVNSFVELFPY